MNNFLENPRTMRYFLKGKKILLLCFLSCLFFQAWSCPLATENHHQPLLYQSTKHFYNAPLVLSLWESQSDKLNQKVLLELFGKKDVPGSIRKKSPKQKEKKDLPSQQGIIVDDVIVMVSDKPFDLHLHDNRLFWDHSPG